MSFPRKLPIHLTAIRTWLVQDSPGPHAEKERRSKLEEVEAVISDHPTSVPTRFTVVLVLLPRIVPPFP